MSGGDGSCGRVRRHVRLTLSSMCAHPIYMFLIGRLAVLALVLVISAGDLGRCAGWEATAEARMACCVDGDVCPMHSSGNRGPTDSTRVVSQAEADSCCAAGERDDASPAARATAGVIAPAVLPQPILLAPLTTSDDVSWRISAPITVDSVPRHLRHSVLLV